jgi:hypothetical protein
MALSQKILQINLKFSGLSGADLEQAWLPAARLLADIPGLRWKIWLMNEVNHEAGGIYLFDDEVSLQDYLAGPIVAAMLSNPLICNINARMFDVMEEHTVITRGPVYEGSHV